MWLQLQCLKISLTSCKLLVFTCKGDVFHTQNVQHTASTYYVYRIGRICSTVLINAKYIGKVWFLKDIFIKFTIKCQYFDKMNKKNIIVNIEKTT